jgi:hypothetical protein
MSRQAVSCSPDNFFSSSLKWLRVEYILVTDDHGSFAYPALVIPGGDVDLRDTLSAYLAVLIAAAVHLAGSPLLHYLRGMSPLRKTYPSIDQVLESEQACPKYQHQVDMKAVDAHLCHVFGVRDLLHLDASVCSEFGQVLLLEDFFLDFF